MADKILDEYFGDLIERYEAGESLLAAQGRLGISRRTLHKFLTRNGIRIRGRGDGQSIRWGRMTPEQRVAQVAQAHTAARGRVASAGELHMKASIRARNPIGSAYEHVLIRLLRDRGIDCIPQLAVGPYNCDIASFPVAVEIFGGNWHWSGRHILRTPKRVRHFLNAGWHVLMIQVGKIDQSSVEVGADVADYVAAHIKSLRSNPTAIREYRVVRGAGDLLAAGSSQDDDATIERTIYRRDGPARKRNSGGTRKATRML